MNSEKVRVWDIGVRIFHWSLVLLFVVAYFSAEEENLVHIYSGYAVLGLISLRVVWGCIGTRYARFSDFIHGPQRVIHYIRGLVTGGPERYLGHNPVGGWMVVTLLAGLFVITVSGLKLYALEEGRGPLAGVEQRMFVDNAYADRNDHETEEHEMKKGSKGEAAREEFWEELHEVSTNITLFLIGLHILGVVVSSRIHNENLIKAMITGNKEKQV